jgi:hypothetical protein
MAKTETNVQAHEPPRSPNLSSPHVHYGSTYDAEQLSNTSGLPQTTGGGHDAETAGNVVARVTPAGQGQVAPAVASMVPGMQDVKEESAHAALHGILTTRALESAVRHKVGSPVQY